MVSLQYMARNSVPLFCGLRNNGRKQSNESPRVLRARMATISTTQLNVVNVFRFGDKRRSRTRLLGCLAAWVTGWRGELRHRGLEGVESRD
ncbi:hypothetical protein E2C01_085154 [Portunus trituberculatus]|uniref:Uncharacterized protein n=1 Tax=Portunus trituberculatus TaxID=210409 RepID=A0A5B7IX62_PORTR|nr:hypothetical protein [Portunus trituberculatus]